MDFSEWKKLEAEKPLTEIESDVLALLTLMEPMTLPELAERTGHTKIEVFAALHSIRLYRITRCFWLDNKYVYTRNEQCSS